MKAKILFKDVEHIIDLANPIDISIRLQSGPNNPNCFWARQPEFVPVKGDGFIGSVQEGGVVDFKDVVFNPHGNGTHTECVGHISGKHSLQECLKQYFFPAYLISCWPTRQTDGDLVLGKEILEGIDLSDCEALIIRTMPNESSKLVRQYSGTNPPYLSKELTDTLVSLGINHLLVDLPSVDRESDGGILSAHHSFWQYPENVRTECTITEMIYVENIFLDGFYFLNLQFANFDLDASPSKPVLFKPE